MDPQISFFINFFIKNGSHSTIHTFKNYFAIMFSISTTISSIQTDPKLISHTLRNSDAAGPIKWDVNRDKHAETASCMK